VPPDPAQLSSIATALDDLTARVTEIADGFSGSPREDLAASLYEVERNLATASSRMRRLLRDLG
jgi:hypothetical protein